MRSGNGQRKLGDYSIFGPGDCECGHAETTAQAGVGWQWRCSYFECHAGFQPPESLQRAAKMAGSEQIGTVRHAVRDLLLERLFDGRPCLPML